MDRSRIKVSIGLFYPGPHPGNMQARAQIIYTGRVQGVFFRANCQRNALSLGLKGWVRNLPDGSVESVVEGEKGAIERHMEWNRSEQPYADVTWIDVSWDGPKGDLTDFTVRR